MQLAVDLFIPLLEKTLEEQVLKEVSGVGVSPAPPVPYMYSDSSRVFPAKSSLLPLMTKLGGDSLFRSLLNYCSASSVIFSFLLLYRASRAISALCPMRQRGAMNTLSFSSSVMASVSVDSSSSILREASSDMRRVSSQLSFFRKSLALMSMMSLRSLRQWVCMQWGSEQGTCSYTQSSFRSSWQIFISFIRQPLCSNSRFFNISPFFSSRSFREENCCASCTRTQRPLPHRSSNGQHPPSTCRIVSIILIIILNHTTPSTTHPSPDGPFLYGSPTATAILPFPIFPQVAVQEEQCNEAGWHKRNSAMKQGGIRGIVQQRRWSQNAESLSELANALQLLLLVVGESQHVVVDVPVQVASPQHLGALHLAFLQDCIQTHVLLCFTNSCSLLFTFYSQLRYYTHALPALDNELIIYSRPFFSKYRSAKYFFPFSFMTDDFSYRSTSSWAMIEASFLCLPIENAALGDLLSGCMRYFSNLQSFQSRLSDQIFSSLFWARMELYLTQHLSLGWSSCMKGLSCADRQ